jgi:class 3 adenylate cyclase
MTATAPSGVVTFLFTDVEGSTRRWEADADAMRQALGAHDKVLRTVIETSGGSLFKHTGDGVCAAFASPTGAVDAAVAAQRAMELPVRMGLATGEAEVRGADYFGAVLNRAARVMASGHGGPILLADSTAVLLSGVDLEDLGPRRLRDLPTAVGVFQVRAPGLPTGFPPLRALDATPGNLRPQPTSLVGRESELAEVHEAVTAHRLVTLAGVGGVGKTRLALEVAARSAASFPDGVWVIELAPVGDPSAVPDAVAAVLGITEQPGMSVAGSVASALEGRSRLLVFDNCEHVLDAAAEMIEAILARSATVKILATSREGLRVADEQLWPVHNGKSGEINESHVTYGFAVLDRGIARASVALGGLQVFTPPQGAGPEFVRDIYKAMLACGDIQPTFRKRPATAFGGFINVAWTFDEDIDLEYHVRRSALPAPGRVRELLELTSRLHGTLLDRHRPLWESHLIESPNDGRFAVYTKIHHALVDGVSALKLMQRSLSTDLGNSEIRVPWALPPRPRQRAGVRPSAVQRLTGTMQSVARKVPSTLVLARAALRVQQLTPPFRAPRTMLNVPIGGARRCAARFPTSARRLQPIWRTRRRRRVLTSAE